MQALWDHSRNLEFGLGATLQGSWLDQFVYEMTTHKGRRVGPSKAARAAGNSIPGPLASGQDIMRYFCGEAQQSTNSPYRRSLGGGASDVDRVRSEHDGQHDGRAGVCLREDSSGQGQLRYAQADSGRDDRIRALRMADSQ